MLPLFSDDFCQWLVDLRMAQFEKLSAVSDGSIAECVQSFVDLVPALEDLHAPSSRKAEEEIFRWVPSIEVFFTLVRSMSAIGRAELATDLGFGMAGSPVLSGRSPLKARTTGESQLVPVPLEKRPRAIDTSQGEPKFLLKAQEAGEARKWGMRLKAIVDRCGPHAAIAGKPNAGSLLSKDEMSTCVESGGFRTIQQRVGHWERLQAWSVPEHPCHPPDH